MIIKRWYLCLNILLIRFLVMVHKIVGAVPNKTVYEFKSLLNTNGKMIRFKIKNNENVQYVLGERNGILEIYVAVQHSQ